MIEIKKGVEIPENLLAFKFSRSSGPGGQNVNKVSTRVTLLLDIADCPAFTEVQKKRIGEMRYGVRLELTATGSPIAFEATVEPVIRLDRDAETGDYRVRIESLPVRIGMAGTYDLAALVPVIPIETLTRHLLPARHKDIPLELEVREISIQEQGIELSLHTRYP